MLMCRLVHGNKKGSPIIYLSLLVEIAVKSLYLTFTVSMATWVDFV